MPTLLQASISSVPAGAVTFLPSTVMFTSAIENRRWSLVAGRSQKPSVVSANDKRRTTNDEHLSHYHLRSRSLKRARLAVQMIFKFFAKLLHNGNCRHSCGVAQRAKSASQHVL